MKPFDECPVCGGKLKRKEVEKLLRGGGNTASLRVVAEVCLHCGERLYPEEVVKAFEEIRLKLRERKFHQLKNTGQSFTVDENWPNKAIQPTRISQAIDT